MESFPPIHEIDHPAMPKSRLNSLLIILMVTLFLSGGALIVLKQIDTYHRKQLYIATNAALPVHKASKTENQKIRELDVESWKTYRNEEYGFELTFTEPLKEYRSGAVYGKSYSYIPFSILDDRGYVDAFAILIYEKSEWEKLKKSNSLPTHNYITENNNKVFIYQLSQDPPKGIPNLLNEINKVISTFKFIEKADTSTWKTYRNEEYGFELQYPGSWKVSENVFSSGSGLQVIFESPQFSQDGKYFQIRISNDSTVKKTPLSDSTYLDFNPIARDSKLGGLKANFYEAPNGYCDGPGCSSPFVAFETRLDLTQFVIQFSGDLKLDEDENRVLSTFKFTK